MYDRIEIPEISEISKINDENLIVNIIQDMILNKEINAQYLPNSRAIIFDHQLNIEEIDKLIDTYKEWEEAELGKKI